jgi:hypothetical protein
MPKLVVAYSFFAFSVLFNLTMTPGLIRLQSANPYLDFGSFLAAGHAANQGLNPYAVYELTYVFRSPGIEIEAVNLNPPVLLPFFQIAARFESLQAYTYWR